MQETATSLTCQGLYHAGLSVSDLDEALSFWEPLLGYPARFRGLLERPYLGESVGYPGVRIDAAILDLPGGASLELLDYQLPDRVANDDATANPGNVHVCLLVADCEEAFRHAVACGGRPVREAGPVTIDAGPNRGARAAYVRTPDGISLELFQRAPVL